MAKKRKSEPAPRDFRNNPFRSLKGISPRSGPPAAGIPASVPFGSAADDEALFERAMRGARPLEPGDEQRNDTSAAEETAPQPVAHDKDEEGLFLDAMSSLGATTMRAGREVDEDSGAAGPRRSSSSRMRQLKKGTIRIVQQLDLHGSLREEALQRLRHFVAGAYARGDRAVLVITGKGANSPGGPVLPGAVSEWLRGPGKEMVAEFHQAPHDKGGSGAVVVFLRSSR